MSFVSFNKESKIIVDLAQKHAMYNEQTRKNLRNFGLIIKGIYSNKFHRANTSFEKKLSSLIEKHENFIFALFWSFDEVVGLIYDLDLNNFGEEEKYYLMEYFNSIPALEKLPLQIQIALFFLAMLEFYHILLFQEIANITGCYEEKFDLNAFVERADINEHNLHFIFYEAYQKNMQNELFENKFFRDFLRIEFFTKPEKRKTECRKYYSTLLKALFIESKEHSSNIERIDNFKQIIDKILKR